ncbi:MAG: DUF2703 domain-containing protein [Candidatus Sumerlaea chitinivorans]|nr:DUF2703 domain-containing protein [Candidatus Sumerlaea chitinivorans]
MIQVKIEWIRLLIADQTCPRCSQTEAEITSAIQHLQQMLMPHGIDVVLEKRSLSPTQFAENPMASNQILINGRPLESWVSAKVISTPCCDVCGDADCRAIEVDNQIHEAVPSHLIVQAGLAAAEEMLRGQGKTKPCCSENPSCCGG